MNIEDFEKEVQKKEESIRETLIKNLQELAKEIPLMDLFDTIEQETIFSKHPRVRWENDVLGISIFCLSSVKGLYNVEIKDDELKLLRTGYSEPMLIYKNEHVLTAYNSIRKFFEYKKQSETIK